MRIIIARVALAVATSAVAPVAAVALAVASPAQAKQQEHTWFAVSYAEGKCIFSPASPEDFYNAVSAGALPGVTVERIAPDAVTKGDDGVIHVHMTGTENGAARYMDFFTTIRACEKFVANQGIKPEQADSGDIN